MRVQRRPNANASRSSCAARSQEADLEDRLQQVAPAAACREKSFTGSDASA